MTYSVSFREMADEMMPATEAQEGGAADGDEVEEAVQYECAFHILPTVAEAEAPAVMERVKGLIAAARGAVVSEECAGQIDLAYEIAKETGGSRRRFNAAHFCWVRFTLAPGVLPTFAEEVGRQPEILRHLIVRLNKAEIQKPFFVRPARGPRWSKGGVALSDTDAVAGDGETAPDRALPDEEGVSEGHNT